MVDCFFWRETMTSAELEQAKIVVKLDELKRKKEDLEWQKQENDVLPDGAIDSNLRIMSDLAEATKEYETFVRFFAEPYDISDAEEARIRRYIAQIDGVIAELQDLRTENMSCIKEILLVRRLIA